MEVVKSTSLEDLRPSMERILACHGIPEVLTTEGGPPYTSEGFNRFCRNMRMEHRTTTPEDAQAKGFPRLLSSWCARWFTLQWWKGETQRKPWTLTCWPIEQPNILLQGRVQQRCSTTGRWRPSSRGCCRKEMWIRRRERGMTGRSWSKSSKQNGGEMPKKRILNQAMR